MTPFHRKTRLLSKEKFSVKKIWKYKFHVKVSNFKIILIHRNHFMSWSVYMIKRERLESSTSFILLLVKYITYINNAELHSSYHWTMKCASSITTALTLSLKDDLRRLRTDWLPTNASACPYTNLTESSTFTNWSSSLRTLTPTPLSFNFSIWSDIMAFSGETTRTQLLLTFSRRSTTKGTSWKMRDFPKPVGKMHKQSCFLEVTAYKGVCCSSFNTKPANLSAVIDSRNPSSNPSDVAEAILTNLFCFQYLPSPRISLWAWAD